MDNTNAAEVELVGKVITKPKVVEGDYFVRIEIFDGWYDVILKQNKRWLKPGTMIKVSGILRDDTLFALTCERIK